MDKLNLNRNTGVNEKRNLGIVLLLVFFGTVIFRIYYSTPIELAYDVLAKWHISMLLVETGDWSLLTINHHAARWAVIVPQYFVSLLLPGRYEGYYLLPLVLSSITIVIFCYVLRRFLDLPAGHLVLFALLTCLEPLNQLLSSQLSAQTFGLFFSALGVLLGLFYFENSNYRYLVAAAVSFFIAYGAHFSFLAFPFGFLLFLLINKRQYTGSTVFIFTLIGCLFVETLTFNILSDWANWGGRLQILKDWGSTISEAGKFLPDSPRRDSITLSDLTVLRWRLLPYYNKLALLVLLFIALGWLIPRVRRQAPPALQLLVYMAIWFGIVISFTIFEVSPVRVLFSPTVQRYSAPIMPFTLAIIVCTLAMVTRIYLSKYQSSIATVLIFLISSSFLFASTTERCQWESNDVLWSRDFRMNFKKTYCGMFRYVRSQNVIPTEPTAFLLRAQKFYRTFSFDYIEGDIAVTGGEHAPLFEILVKVTDHDARFVETPTGWYSIDGLEKADCVLNLGATKISRGGYINCATNSSRKMPKDNLYYFQAERMHLQSGL